MIKEGFKEERTLKSWQDEIKDREKYFLNNPSTGNLVTYGDGTVTTNLTVDNTRAAATYFSAADIK